MSETRGRPVANRYKVPVRTWRRWSKAAQKVFNILYESMRPGMQWVYMHPDAPLMDAKHWATVRWNAAWEAANAINGDGVLRTCEEGGIPYGNNKRRVKHPLTGAAA